MRVALGLDELLEAVDVRAHLALELLEVAALMDGGDLRFGHLRHGVARLAHLAVQVIAAQHGLEFAQLATGLAERPIHGRDEVRDLVMGDDRLAGQLEHQLDAVHAVALVLFDVDVAVP